LLLQQNILSFATPKAKVLNEEEKGIIEQIKHSLYSALADIKRGFEGGSVIGSFMLGSCFIDAMAGFKYGQDGRLKLGKVYREFVGEYLKDYDKVALYYDLRCQLLHNYSEGGSYEFTYRNPEKHLQFHDGKRKFINLENFIRDLELAMVKLFTELDESASTRNNALKRFEKYGLLKAVN
jgi:hypothetical protein